MTSQSLGADKLSSLIKDNIDPFKLGLREVSMRKSREGIVIDSASKEGIKNLEEELNNNPATKGKIDTRRPKKRLPQIKIVRIPEDFPTKQLSERIVSQNDLNCDPEDITVVKSWKGRSGVTVVAELGRRAFEALKGKSKMYIFWSVCPFYDNTFVLRCKNCAKIGHLERDCDNNSRCTECVGDHHFRQCSSRVKQCRACHEAELPNALR